MKFVRTLACCLAAFYTFFSYSAYAEERADNIALLERALAAGKMISYSAKTKIPVIAENNFPIQKECTLYRSMSPDGTLKLRMESSGLPVWINRPDGQYAIAGDRVGKIFEIPQLWYFEQLNTPLSAEELQNAQFVVENAVYNKRPCRHMMVTTTSDSIKNQLLQRLDSTQEEFMRNRLKDQLQSLPARQTVRRIFWIDEETGVILARKHYNAQGNNLLSIELGTVDFAAPDEALFELPNEVTCLAATPARFSADIQNAAPSTPAPRKATWNRWRRKIQSVPTWVFLLIGGSALGAAFAHRRMRRKNRETDSLRLLRQ